MDIGDRDDERTPSGVERARLESPECDTGSTKGLKLDPMEPMELMVAPEDSEVSSTGGIPGSCQSEAADVGDPGDPGDPGDDTCAICLDELPDPGQKITRETRQTQFMARVRPCGHLYHDFCIKAWAEKANTCPQCRGRFNIIELVAEHHVIDQIHIDDKLFPLEVDESIPPEFVDELSPEQPPEFHHQHLQNQLCCLCDASTDAPFAICTECSSGYHLSCLGISDFTHFHCPVCDSEQDLDSIVTNRAGQRVRRSVHSRAIRSSFMQELRRQIQSNRYNQLGLTVPVRRRIIRPSYRPSVDDDNIDYVSIVERNKQRMNKEGHSDEAPDDSHLNKEERMAWRILDTMASGREVTPHETSSGNSNKERKYKRPKHRRRQQEEEVNGEIVINSAHNPLRLTERALSLHDLQLEKTTLQPIHHQDHNSSKELSYNQKMIVQRLLLKPKLKSLHLPSNRYTRTNRAVSRKLYREIAARSDAVYWLNSLEETAERDGIDMRNKSQVDELLRKDERDSAFRRDFDPLVNRLLVEELKHE
ncbi:DEKNAAC101163 [Brettanomyces naardenensis]|uniref:DEKNAAC101163 n=1 Tax=Brettanomyces naardenensis TaxID=13370 RepID=A0A448YH84_BRENA|nr:DEKNAAC101163 [Brettanomyces naardenensis]